MKIEFEVNARLVVVASLAGFVGLFALHAAYLEGFMKYWPQSSQDLAAWIQAFGSLLALCVAIWIPYRERQKKIQDDLIELANDADITIRFHAELLITNEAMLGVAISNMPNKARERNRNEQVIPAIMMLRSMSFDQIRVIERHNCDLGRCLADFNCELELLKGILDRNGNDVCILYGLLSKTIYDKLDRLDKLSSKIRGMTVLRPE